SGPQKAGYSRWYFWVAAAAAAVLVVGVVVLGLRFGGGDDPDPVADRTATSEPTAGEEPTGSASEETAGGSQTVDRTFGLGVSVGLAEGWTVSVEDPKMDDTDAVMSYNSSNEEPGDGKVYATVSTRVTNDGSEPLDMFWGLYISYFDESGEEYLP